MNVIAFQGSPRKGGNTELLLREAVRAVDEAGHGVRPFDLNGMDIRPCQGCGGCEETGECIIIDDMAVVASAIRTADRVILASPIYFSGLSAQAKNMIDRCQQFWCEKYLLKRPVPAGPCGRKGLLILVGGRQKKIGIECSEATGDAFFKTISVPEHMTLAFLGVDALGAIVKHPTAMKEAYEAGKELIRR